MITAYKTPEERVGSLVGEARYGKASDYLNQAMELCDYIRKLEQQLQRYEYMVAMEN